MSSRVVGVGRVVGGRAARALPMAAASVADGDAVRHRPTHRGRLAAGRWGDRRLEALLLFHLRRGAQDRIARRPTASARADALGRRPTAGLRPGRHAHQTLWPPCGRGGHPPQSHTRAGRQQVPLRPHLGDAGVDRPARAVGYHRPADSGQALYPAARHRQAPWPLPLAVSDQAPTGRGS